MFFSSLDRVSKFRGMLNLARPENSRMVAASIGGHLEIIVTETGFRDEVAGATNAVRNASLGFLTSLHRTGDVAGARRAVLTSLDQLEAHLG